MLSVSGDMQAAEARKTVAAIAARQRGSVWVFYGAMFGLIVGGMLLGCAVAGVVDAAADAPILSGSGPGLAGLSIGAGIYLVICRPWLARRFRSRMADRGFSLAFSQTLTITDEALSLETGPLRRAADWSAVTEVFKVKGYWVFLVHMEPWFAPIRFFGTPAEETAFLGAALARMSDAARRRSPEALGLIMAASEAA